jgi:hypothetical protein
VDPFVGVFGLPAPSYQLLTVTILEPALWTMPRQPSELTAVSPLNTAVSVHAVPSVTFVVVKVVLALDVAPIFVSGADVTVTYVCPCDL